MTELEQIELLNIFSQHAEVSPYGTYYYTPDKLPELVEAVHNYYEK